METKRHETRSERFSVLNDNGVINFEPKQFIVSAIIKNEGTINATLYNGLTLRPGEFISLTNNNDVCSFRNDVIDVVFDSGAGTKKVITIVDKKVLVG